MLPKQTQMRVGGSDPSSFKSPNFLTNFIYPLLTCLRCYFFCNADVFSNILFHASVFTLFHIFFYFLHVYIRGGGIYESWRKYMFEKKEHAIIIAVPYSGLLNHSSSCPAFWLLPYITFYQFLNHRAPETTRFFFPFLSALRASQPVSVLNPSLGILLSFILGSAVLRRAAWLVHYAFLCFSPVWAQFFWVMVIWSSYLACWCSVASTCFQERDLMNFLHYIFFHIGSSFPTGFSAAHNFHLNLTFTPTWQMMV